MKHLILLLLGLGLSGLLPGQRTNLFDEPKGETLVSSGGGESFSALVPTPDGEHIALVGTAKRGSNGNPDDILFVLANAANLAPKRTAYIGRSGFDAGKAIAPLPNGGFLVAGTSETIRENTSVRKRYHGARDGWLLWLDEKGRTRSELLLGGNQDDAFTFLHALPDGSWLAAGHRGEEGWLVRFRKTDQPEMLWEYRYPTPDRRPGEVFAAAVNDQDEIILAGRTGTEDDANIWVLGLTLEGQELFSKTYLKDERSRALGAQPLPDGAGWAIAGEAGGQHGRGDGFIMLLGRDGTEVNTARFGGSGADLFKDIRLAPDGDFLLLGESLSHQRGARYPALWGVRLNDELEEKDAFYFGSKLEESAESMALLPNGDWLAIGSSYRQLLKGRQAGIWRIGRTRDQQKATTATLEVIDQTSNYISLERSGAAWSRPGLELRLREVLPPGRIYPQRLVAWSPGCPGTFVMPLPEKIHGDYLLELVDDKKQALGTGVPVSFTPLENDAVGQAMVELELVGVERTSGSIEKWLLEITNLEEKRLESPRLLISGTEGCFVTESELNLTPLLEGETLEYKLPVRRLEEARAECTPRIELTDSRGQSLVSILPAFASLTSPVPAAAPTITNSLVITWLDPNPDLLEHPEIVSESEEITLQVKIISTEKLRKKDFEIHLNGRSLRSGQKLDEVQFSGGDYQKTVTQRVVLEEGLNKIYASMAHPGGQESTDTLKVVYTPALPNLHLVSIGVPSYDLAYTTNDARDVAQLFRRAENYGSRAFGHVFVDTLLLPENTTKTAILKSLRRLDYRKAKNQIKPNDLLMVFVSSHGISSDEGGFHIAASDYDQPFLRETSIDFASELTDYLGPIDCRKLFLIDACHSGEAGGTTTANQLTKYLGNHRNLNTLFSCRAEEYSYEDDEWKNGAFTEAIVSTVSDFYRGGSAVDLNGDDRLTLQELYQAIEPLTNKLARTKKPRPRTEQNPILGTTRQGGGGIVLFTR